jgi:hypothetical protein
MEAKASKTLCAALLAPLIAQLALRFVGGDVSPWLDRLVTPGQPN